jgi:hypothetical protein
MNKMKRIQSELAMLGRWGTTRTSQNVVTEAPREIPWKTNVCVIVGIRRVFIQSPVLIETSGAWKMIKTELK